jgi:hypothetical protein
MGATTTNGDGFGLEHDPPSAVERAAALARALRDLGRFDAFLPMSAGVSGAR